MTDKKRWTVGAAVAASTYVGDFEAETPQAAIELARRKAGVRICWQCSERLADLELTHFYACTEEECFDEADEEAAADLERILAEKQETAWLLQRLAEVRELAAHLCVCGAENCPACQIQTIASEPSRAR